MNLHRLLLERQDAGRPVGVGLIGVGKFGSMFLSQAPRTPGLRVAGLADLAPERARAALAEVGFADAGVPVGEDAAALIADPAVEVVVEATGDPAAGIRHALLCVDHGKHAVMVNVEADALAGPLLARRAADAGLVYSLAYGDQPALICEQVDWARAAGFAVVAAGKGTLYMPGFEASTPETVWGHYGIAPERAAASGLNAKMFNSFLDGTKSAIEMAAVANACDLTPAPDGLAFPPCGSGELAAVLKPRADGGTLHAPGTVEVVSSLTRDGGPVRDDLRWGVYVTFVGDGEYARRCFREYGLVTDDSGRYTALYRPYHLIGLELGVSVAAAALRGEASGSARAFNADVAAVAKRTLAARETLDGEGGYTVWGRLLPAADSIARGALPLGLAKGARLRREVAAGEVIGLADVDLDRASAASRARERLLAEFEPTPARSAQR